MPQPLRFRKRGTFLPMLLLLIFVLPFGFAVPFALWSSFILSPLQKQYFPTYMAMALTGKTARTPSVWWIWKTGPKRKPELAEESDVVSAPAIGKKGFAARGLSRGPREGLDRTGPGAADGEPEG